jgi:esterase/lipase superfamily enzyme
MGELEGPSIWRLEFREDPERHVVLLKETVRDLNRAAFLRAVEERVSTSKEREALVFIHGFNTTFEDAARRMAQISYDLGFRGAAILYSWPSQGSLSPAAYLKDGSNAELSVQALQGLLDDLRLRSGARTIHLVAHSMGNRLLTSALAGLSAKGQLSPRFRHVAFMAPDVRTESFKQLAERFRSTADRLTLYASSKDAALMASQELNGYARAGQGGKNIVVLNGLDSVDASSADTSRLGIGHQYYGDSHSVLADLFQVMQGKSPDERFGLKRAPSGRYWEMK